MKRYRVYQVDSFTSERFTGNPAGVVSNADGLSEHQMQAIARELNNSETAFILSPSGADHDVRIRFFTPTTEVPICGHATIAAHFVRAIENDLPTCTVKHLTGVGILPVDIVKSGSSYEIIMTQGKPEISEPLNDEIENDIMNALGLSPLERDERCQIKIASTGHSKVMIGIKDKKTLNGLQPNMYQLAKISERIGSNGYFVFTVDSDDNGILTHGRMFAPAIGIPEDPVTGNANGPLGAYLVDQKILASQDEAVSFMAKQGEAMGRPGIVKVSMKVNNGKAYQVQIGGRAVVAFKTELEI
ncbi:MAG: PhzF family isomerase [Pseudobacteriovorax sp.]|nr:PhzF family isomerase [Pseudobacteriovorax sp.]